MQRPATLITSPAERVRDSRYWIDLVFGRALPAVFFSIFVAYKVLQVGAGTTHLARADHMEEPQDYLDLIGQVLGLVYYCLLATLYATRLPKRAGNAHPAVVLVSFFGAFSILGLAFLPRVPPRADLLLLSECLILFGLVYTLWALAYLRRSFSILPEARQLVTGGPYSLSRHPVYIGEAFAAIGVALPGSTWHGVVLITCFLLAQLVRINIEEKVLLRQYPVEYAEYRRRVPRYLPVPRFWR